MLKIEIQFLLVTKLEFLKLLTFPQRSKNADCRGASCAVATNAVCALCNVLERHTAAFVLSMLKINAAAWRLHSVLGSALWGLLERCVHAVKTPRKSCIRVGVCNTF